MLVMSAVAMPVMIGATGLALDSVQWMLWQRQLQQVADAGAIAGAYAWAQGDNVSSAAGFAVDEDEHIAFLSAPTVSQATVGTQRRVTVAVSAQKALPFSGMFLSTAPVLSRTSTAALIRDGNFCVLALGQHAATGISTSGNASINLKCGMASNADGDESITAGGSSRVEAEPFLAVGGITGGSTRLVSETPPQAYGVPLKDPYADRTNPVLPGDCSSRPNSYSPKKNEVVPLTPGCFSGLSLSGQGTVELDTGIYYIDGGELSFGSQITVNGTGVVFVLTSSTAATNGTSVATLNANAGATLNLSAPAANATGELANYRGIVIFQDRRAASGVVNKINGHAEISLDGSIYMPKQHLEYSGGAGVGTKCVQIVSDSITFTGNSSLGNDCENSPNNFNAFIVRLIA